MACLHRANMIARRRITDSFDDDMSALVPGWEGVEVLVFPIWAASQPEGLMLELWSSR